jgi:hypothetical protein
MTAAEVLKSEATKSTVTTGYVSGYSVQRSGKVVGFVQARLENWRLVWSVYSRTDGGKLTNKSSNNLVKLLAEFGDVDLMPTEIVKPDLFFQTLPAA